eukprot:CAMPEP_0170614878 /NCGR_PEP_ID=MMETSP0224-20130122/25038_1 /TAXON_ID=285029 /ORGANISM="Togula jolla, Strain CCCM 725" /LENGTH=503 /DNA_ID=CAMNT_0010940571 /DNA_START=129 /DNA_END=1640 /DNA_ORIENTATION=+
MIDAGSSGSRLHVFRWPGRIADPLHPQYPATTIPEELFSVATRPGISAFAKNPDGLVSYMRDLIEQAKVKLENLRELWSIIPIYLKATAGARDLFQDQRDVVFAKLRDILFKGPFRFDDEYWARTISGEEEGVHGWLTINAVKGTFRGQKSWGSLDLGGSSMQIAFIPQDISIIQNYFPLHLAFRHLHLYSHSYLEFGYRDANMRAVKYLVEEQGLTLPTESAPAQESDVVQHPCFKKGAPFQQPMFEPFVRGGGFLWVQGSDDFKACMELAVALLHKSARCYVPYMNRDFSSNSSEGSCAIAGAYEPNLHELRFMAGGQFSSLAKKMGLVMGRHISLSQLQPAIQRVCANISAFSEFDTESDDPEGFNEGVEVKDPMGLPESRCWKVVWMYNLLRNGLKFKEDSTQIVFARKKLGWALGAMMTEVNYYPWTRDRSSSDDVLALAASNIQAPVYDEGPEQPNQLALGILLGLIAGVLSTLSLTALWLRRGRPRADTLLYMALH